MGLCQLTASGAFLGMDSLLASLLIGPFLQNWRKRAQFALLFGLSDWGATIVGASLPHVPPAPPEIVLYVVAVLLIALAARRSRRWLLVMPAFFSLDNLAAGWPSACAPALGVGSGVAAIVGLACGSILGRSFLVCVRYFRAVTWAWR